MLQKCESKSKIRKCRRIDPHEQRNVKRISEITVEIWASCDESCCQWAWQKQNNTNLIWVANATICALLSGVTAHKSDVSWIVAKLDLIVCHLHKSFCTLAPIPQKQKTTSNRPQVCIKTYHKCCRNCCYCHKKEHDQGHSVWCAVEYLQWTDGWCEPVSSRVTLIVCLSPELGEEDQLRWCRSRWPDRFSTVSTRSVTFSYTEYMAAWLAVASQISLRLHTCSASISASTF